MSAQTLAHESCVARFSNDFVETFIRSYIQFLSVTLGHLHMKQKGGRDTCKVLYY